MNKKILIALTLVLAAAAGGGWWYAQERPGHSHTLVKKMDAQGQAYWTCPMHPQVRQPGPGACPICGMALEPEVPTEVDGASPELVDFSRRLWWTLPLTVIVLLLSAGLIGLYDGLLGPGTGTFLIISLTALVGTGFLESSAMAKVINTGTNLGALTVFELQGNVLWLLGLGLAVANIAGAQLGARTVLGGGAKFIRYALLTLVVVALALGGGGAGRTEARWRSASNSTRSRSADRLSASSSRGAA